MVWFASSARRLPLSYCSCFFFIHPSTTEIYTLSLHDALPICNALTVVVSYVNPTRKPVVDAARSSAHPVYRCIKACTRKEPQRTTAKISLAKAHSCAGVVRRSEEHTSELQSRQYLVCRLLLEK